MASAEEGDAEVGQAFVCSQYVPVTDSLCELSPELAEKAAEVTEFKASVKHLKSHTGA